MRTRRFFRSRIYDKNFAVLLMNRTQGQWLMAAKYYIYARGRWCEVDTRSGRVEGFEERARFLFFRGGKLELARTAKVLKGLRALSGGISGPVRDGPPLPCRKRRHRKRYRRECDSRARAHHGCCLHTRCDENANNFTDKVVRPSLPAPPLPEVLSPRKPRIIYSDESLQPRLDKSPVKDKLKKHKDIQPVERVAPSSGEEIRRATRSTASRVKKDKIETKGSSKVEKFQQNHKTPALESIKLSSEEDKRPTRKTPSTIRKDNKVEKNKSSKAQVKSARKLSRKEVFIKNRELKTRNAADNKRSDSEGSDKRGNCSDVAKELVIDEDDVILLRNYLAKRGIGDLHRFDNDEEYMKRVFYRLNPLVTLERCKPLENLLRQKMTLKEFARNLGLRSVAEVTPEKRYRMRLSTKLARTADSETDKENIIQPKRRKLWNNDKEHYTSITSRSSDIKPREIPKPALNEDSSKDTTDSDTEFKRKVREQLARKSKQRASAVEREKETSTVMGENERRATRSSIRGPGLLKEQNKVSETKGSSVQTVSSEDVTRRTRSSDRGLRARALKEQNKGSDTSDSAFEKTTFSPKKAAAKDTERNAGKANLNRNKKGRVENGKKADERVEKMKTAVVRSMTEQPVKIRASSVPGGREYTSLEDHAIVAWVSQGDRQRRVNGNALWRELQGDYSGITGQERSWHSLRNRYLRYVLPALGRLALPPAQASRLRAAAAAGIHKASAASRRNSIYDAPVVRSASARAPRPPPETPAPKPPADAPPAEKRTPTKPTTRSPRRAPAASPTYSAITRRFARMRGSLSSPLPTKKK